MKSHTVSWRYSLWAPQLQLLKLCVWFSWSLRRAFTPPSLTFWRHAGSITPSELSLWAAPTQTFAFNPVSPELSWHSIGLKCSWRACVSVYVQSGATSTRCGELWKGGGHEIMLAKPPVSSQTVAFSAPVIKAVLPLCLIYLVQAQTERVEKPSCAVRDCHLTHWASLTILTKHRHTLSHFLMA